MVKAIFCDLDGTLLRDNCTISESNLSSIKKLKEKDIIVVISTGRSIKESQDIIDLVLPDYFIGMNGAFIKDCSNDKVIYNCESYISMDTALKVESILKKHNTYFQVYTDNDTYITEVSRELMFKSDLPVAYLDQYASKSIIYSDLTKLKVVKFILASVSDKELFYKDIQSINNVKLVHSQNDGYEIIPDHINKGIAMNKLLQHLNISSADAVAIGDSGNDYEMLENAGLGVAMGNALPILKDIADFITLTNEEDGVSYVINQLLLKTI